MKKIILTFIVCLSVSALWAQTNFRSLSVEEAVAAAAQEKKMVFIDFYTDWCGPCKMMAKKTFPQPKVGDFMNEHFVSLKLNAEKEGKELAVKFGVKAFPTYILLDEKGQKMNEMSGAMDGDEFIEKMKRLMNRELSPARMAERYNAGERTPELVNNYALHMMEQRKEEEGFKIVNDYFHSLTDAQRLKLENAFLFTRYTLQLDDVKARFMIEHSDEFDASLKGKINEQIGRLYRTDLITYFSGFRRKANQYKEETYQELKKNIQALGLDKKFNFAPMFVLIEGREACDDAAYLDLCAKEYSNLSEGDRGLLIVNLTRLVESEEPAILKKMIQLIRSNLSTMSVSNISMSARVLSIIERKLED